MRDIFQIKLKRAHKQQIAALLIFFVLVVVGVVTSSVLNLKNMTAKMENVKFSNANMASFSGVFAVITVLSLEENMLMRVNIEYEPFGDYAITFDGLRLLNRPVTIVAGIQTKSFAPLVPMANDEMSLDIIGNRDRYPFDNYIVTLDISAALQLPVNSTQSGNASFVVVPIAAELRGAVNGWNLKYSFSKSGTQGQRITSIIEASRAGTVIFFSLFIFICMWLLSMTAFILAFTLWFRQRKVEPPTIGFTAGLLFALPLIRNSQPYAPAIGAAVDLAGFLWNEFLVTTAVLLLMWNYIIKFTREKKNSCSSSSDSTISSNSHNCRRNKPRSSRTMNIKMVVWSTWTIVLENCPSRAICGVFMPGKSQQLLLWSLSSLELFQISPDGSLKSILNHPLFCCIRNIARFRLPGQLKDYLIITSDSGCVSVLEYIPSPLKSGVGKFVSVHQEVFGKTGCRRSVPGQMLAIDPVGRSIMIAALENKKIGLHVKPRFGKQINNLFALGIKQTESDLPLSYSFEHPIFASIEIDASEADADITGQAIESTERKLTYYELDLGLNHVVRKWSTSLPKSASHLLALPGGKDGPSGVIVCCEGFILWLHEGCDSVKLPIPKRPGCLPDFNNNTDSDQNHMGGAMIISSVVHKLKKTFFALLQTEDGDVFKLTVDFTPSLDGTNSKINALKIKYFETLPPARDICLLKSGYMFLACESGNHTLYQIESLGDDDDDEEFFSSDFDQMLSSSTLHDCPVFNPRTFKNVNPVDEIQNLAPLIETKVLNLTNEEAPQIYAICGQGSRSTFRILRDGLECNEIAVSELPGNPYAVWTVRQGEYDAFIVISFVNATLVLSVGDTVEEVTDTGLLVSTPTIAVSPLGNDALVQVYSLGIRHIRADRRVSEWRAPPGSSITKASCNSRQVIISLSSGYLVYFELDSMGNLNEFGEKKQMSSRVASLSIPSLGGNRQRAQYLAVGCEDNTVRLLSLNPQSCLESVGMQALSAVPESLLLIEMFDTIAQQKSLFLNIGLSNGVLLRTSVDTVTGELSDTRMRFLGAKAIKLFPISVGGSSGLIALSSRPWISFTHQNRSRLTPVSYEALEYASSFCSEQCPEGVVAIAGNTLRILSFDKLDARFHQSCVKLSYTPRKFVLDEQSNHFVIVEADHGTFCPSEAPSDRPDPEHFGLPRAPDGKWGSCVRLLSPFSGETADLHQMDNNDAALTVTSGVFLSHPQETLFIVGGAQGLIHVPRSFKSGFISVYRVSEGKLVHIHRTEVDCGVPIALCAFQGRLLVGMGKTMRLYEIGIKKLLRKCESKSFPFNIVKIETQGDRIIASDSQESILFCQYRHYDNQIIIFADDYIPRWTTSSVMLDYDTVCGGDKFGNIFALRLDKEISMQMDEDTTGSTALYDRGYLNGAPEKLAHVFDFHIGAPITSLQTSILTPGGRSVIVYSTITGGIGVQIPFTNKDDINFFSLLEIAMRQQFTSLAGRDHLSWRSSYNPVSHCIDGDLIECYNSLPGEKKRAICRQLDRTTAEVAKRIEDIRNRNSF